MGFLVMAAGKIHELETFFFIAFRLKKRIGLKLLIWYYSKNIL